MNLLTNQLLFILVKLVNQKLTMGKLFLFILEVHIICKSWVHYNPACR